MKLRVKNYKNQLKKTKSKKLMKRVYKSINDIIITG